MPYTLAAAAQKLDLSVEALTEELGLLEDEANLLVEQNAELTGPAAKLLQKLLQDKAQVEERAFVAPPFDFDTETLCRLEDWQLEGLVLRLLEAERRTLEERNTLIEFNRNTNANDGGIDVSIQWAGVELLSPWVPSSDLVIQCKVSNPSKSEHRKELEKSRVKPRLDAGAHYLMVVAKSGFDKVVIAKDLVHEGLISEDRLHIRSADDLRDWILQHPTVIPWLLQQLGRDHSIKLKSVEAWNAKIMHQFDIHDARLEPLRARLKPIVTVLGRSFRVTGGPGVGKTHLVTKALLDLQADATAFVLCCSSIDFSESELIEQVILYKQQGARLILSIDDCSAKLASRLEDCLHEGLSLVLTMQGEQFDPIDNDPFEGTAESPTIPTPDEEFVAKLALHWLKDPRLVERRLEAHIDPNKTVFGSDCSAIARTTEGFLPLTRELAGVWLKDHGEQPHGQTLLQLMVRAVQSRTGLNDQSIETAMRLLSLFSSLPRKGDDLLLDRVAGFGLKVDAVDYDRVGNALHELGFAWKAENRIGFRPQALANRLAAEEWPRFVQTDSAMLLFDNNDRLESKFASGRLMHLDNEPRLQRGLEDLLTRHFQQLLDQLTKETEQSVFVIYQLSRIVDLAPKSIAGLLAEVVRLKSGRVPDAWRMDLLEALDGAAHYRDAFDVSIDALAQLAEFDPAKPTFSNQRAMYYLPRRLGWRNQQGEVPLEQRKAAFQRLVGKGQLSQHLIEVALSGIDTGTGYMTISSSMPGRRRKQLKVASRESNFQPIHFIEFYTDHLLTHYKLSEPSDEALRESLIGGALDFFRVKLDDLGKRLMDACSAQGLNESERYQVWEFVSLWSDGSDGGLNQTALRHLQDMLHATAPVDATPEDKLMRLMAMDPYRQIGISGWREQRNHFESEVGETIAELSPHVDCLETTVKAVLNASPKAAGLLGAALAQSSALNPKKTLQWLVEASTLSNSDHSALLEFGRCLRETQPELHRELKETVRSHEKLYNLFLPLAIDGGLSKEDLKALCDMIERQTQELGALINGWSAHRIVDLPTYEFQKILGSLLSLQSPASGGVALHLLEKRYSFSPVGKGELDKAAFAEAFALYFQQSEYTEIINVHALHRLTDSVLSLGESDDVACKTANMLLNSLLSKAFAWTWQEDLAEDSISLLIMHFPSMSWSFFSTHLFSEEGGSLRSLFLNGSPRFLGSNGAKHSPLALFDHGSLMSWASEPEHTKRAPVFIAGSYPLFEYIENPEAKGKVLHRERFHPKLADVILRFGDQAEVIDALSSNLNTGSWSGSLVPYYQDVVKALEFLKSEASSAVRKNLDGLIERIKMRARREHSSEVRFGRED